MYGRSDVNEKLSEVHLLTFTRGFSYIVSILFTHVKPVKVYVRTHVKIIHLKALGGRGKWDFNALAGCKGQGGYVARK